MKFTDILVHAAIAMLIWPHMTAEQIPDSPEIAVAIESQTRARCRRCNEIPSGY